MASSDLICPVDLTDVHWYSSVGCLFAGHLASMAVSLCYGILTSPQPCYR